MSVKVVFNRANPLSRMELPYAAKKFLVELEVAFKEENYFKKGNWQYRVEDTRLIVDLARHDPKLVAVVEKLQTQGKNDGFEIHEIKGNRYTIVDIQFGGEEVKEPEDFQWIDVP